MTDPEKKEISEEGQETLDSLQAPILEIANAKGGMTLEEWFKALCKLARNARRKKAQKLTGEIDTTSLKRGVTQVAKTDKETLLIVPSVDHETRLAALGMIGKAAGYSITEGEEVEPQTIININAPDKDAVKIVPEGEGQ
jgi:hypothetical protein